MKLSFCVNESSEWLEKIAQQIGCKVEDNIIHFPSPLAQGYMKNVYFANGLSVNFLYGKFHEPVIAHRKAGPHVPFSPVHFYTHENQVTQQIAGTKQSIGKTTARGIFWPSASIESTWEYPVNQWVSNLVINIDHNMLLDKLTSNDDSYIKDMLNGKKPFYVFEHITPDMILLLKEITKMLKESDNSLSQQLLLEGNVTHLLGLFMGVVNQRKKLGKALDLNAQDVDRLFKVKETLLEDLSTTPPIKELAEQYGFSESKLQKLFKQVFGKSLYQYALYERMLWAHKMLSAQKCSVSEVGYQLGYSNLSHFTKAFRNQFGINPKSFRQQQAV